MLKKIEDGLLVICDGDLVTMRIAQKSLGSWFEMNLGKVQVKQAALKLCKIKFAKWHYWHAAKYHVSVRIPRSGVCPKRIALKSTALGEQYLSQVREENANKKP